MWMHGLVGCPRMSRAHRLQRGSTVARQKPAASRRQQLHGQPLLLLLMQQRSPVPLLITMQHRLINVINSKLLQSTGAHAWLSAGLSVWARLCRGAPVEPPAGPCRSLRGGMIYGAAKRV